jgi:large repetitive protein
MTESHPDQRPDGARRGRVLLPLVGVALAVAWVSGIAAATVPPTEPAPTEPAPTEPPPTPPPTTQPAPVPTTEPAPTEPATSAVPPPTTPPATTTPPPTTSEPAPTTTVPPAPVIDIDLVPLCTAAGDAGTRTFRVDNHGPEAVDITLRNVDAGEEISGSAPPGSSTWNVPASPGANTTQVLVDGQVVATAASTNLLCAALHGRAVCDTDTGTTTVTWTISNNDGSPAIVVRSARGVEYNPNPDAPFGGSTGTEVIDGPAQDQQLSETATVQHADGGTSDYSDEITAAACSGPELPPDVTFTFSKTPSVLTAGVGDTVEYVYCGQNTSAIPLEVVRLVDDRLGVVIELPDVQTVVAPGESLCNTDIGQQVSYTVTRSDLGTTIRNSAVVTVRTQEPTPRVFQATATAAVRVPLGPRLRDAIQGGEKTWVCHRTLSDKNPYNKNDVSSSSTDASGHINHAEDIIPPGPWGPGQNYNPDNGAIWTNECNNLTALPDTPTLTQATCSSGAVIPGYVTTKSTLGVRYTVAPTNLGDGRTDVTVTVTATLVLGYDWGPMPAGWTKVNATTATWTGVLKGTTCTQVTPVDPAVKQAECAHGVLEPPVLTFAQTTGITYTVTPQGPFTAGQTVTVTATLQPGFALPTTLPSGWTQASPTTATRKVTFNKVSCHEVTPADPQVTQAKCTNGVVVPPVVTTAGTDGVLYAVIPSNLGDGKTDVEVKVTASVVGGYAWVVPLPAGWTKVGDTTGSVVFTVTLRGTSCQVVTPAPPTVTQAVCTGGVVSAPTLSLPTTTGITYTAQPGGPYLPGQSVTVTATLDPAGVGWPATMPSGWTQTSPTRATYAFTFAPVSCLPAVPANPQVVQATCSNGEVVAPSVTPPTTTGVTYVVAPSDLGDGTANVGVTVTATIQNGYGWGTVTPPWVRVNDTTARLTLTLTGSSCAQRVPAAPTVTEAVCADGVVSAPTLTLANTDGITYKAVPGGPYAPGQSVTVTSTLAAAGVGWPATMPPGWTRTSPTTATYQVVFAAVSCTPVAPAAPAVTQATCVNGAVSAPTVTLSPTTGVSYVADPAGPYDGTKDTTVTVTATVQPGFGWGTVTAPWVRVNATTARLTVTLMRSSCAQRVPAAPAVVQAVCANGVVSQPTLTLATTDGITYSVDPSPPYQAGQGVLVTATLAPTGVGWPDHLPDGWTRRSATQATFAVTFDAVSCTPVLPAMPTVAQATCANGEVTTPEVTAPSTTGIVYVLDPPGPYDGSADVQVTVTATVTNGYGWGTIAAPWVRVDDATARSTVTLTGTSCDEVTPVAPDLTQAVCANGVLSRPTLELAQTDGITYSVAPAAPYLAGQAVTVTATLRPAEVGWPAQLPPGWARTSPTTATFEVRFDEVSCTPVAPVAPTVVQATCANGEVTAPEIAPPNTTGIVYVVDPASPYDGTKSGSVTVTATLVDGFEWAQMPPGWTRVDPMTATLTVELMGTTCDEVTPVAPALKQAVCANGALSVPTLELARTDGITYSVEPGGPFHPGQSVTVTATLDPGGVGWPHLLPDGWTRRSNTTATIEVTFDNVSCTPVAPVNPEVTQATCANGAVTVPEITLPQTIGVVYVLDPIGPYDGTRDTTVTVTATLPDGFEWMQMPPGWTRVDATTATFTVQLVGTSCDKVMPVAPALTQAVCVGGVVSAASLTLADTDGISYTVDPPAPYIAGQSVTMTATLRPAGVGWPATLPPGWARTSPTTATLTVTFDTVACTPVSPVDPGFSLATCAEGTVSAPSVALPDTPGVKYTLRPSDLGDGSADLEVVVTATVDDGFGWGTIDPPWVRVDEATARLTQTLPGTSCDVVTPVAPTVTQAVCANGVLSAPMLELATTDGITYSVDPAGPYTPGQSVTVTATLAPAGVGWPGELPDGWARQSNTVATFDVSFNDVSCTPVAPVDPTLTQATCVNGAVTAPEIALPNTPGVIYVLDPGGPYEAGQTVTVTATLNPGFAWPDDLGGWTEQTPATATRSVTFDAVSCIEVTPVDPRVRPATCANGAVTAPEIILPTTAGAEYVMEPSDLGNGTESVEVTVTATLRGGYGWVDPLPAGWERVNDTTARWTVTLAASSCDEVTPVAPELTQAECVGGIVSRPTLTLTETDGVTYAAEPRGPYVAGQSVTVTATLDPDGVGWPASMPAGWTRVSTTRATYVLTFDPLSCVPVVPADPTVVQATCTNGEVAAPTITLPETAGIDYVLEPSDFGDGTADLEVTVTATVEDGFGWGTLTDPWVRVDETTATLTVTLAGTSCDEATPAAPALSQAVCANGVVSRPTLTLADTDGITYSADPEEPYRAGQSVTVIATLRPAGVGWPESLPDGWTRSSATRATFTVTFNDVSCIPVEPVVPAVVQATCANGAVTAPEITPPTTTGVEYVLDPPGPYDGSADVAVTVTATVTDGFGWTQMPPGWTQVDAATATFTVQLTGTTCDEVTPVAPGLTQAVCANGVVSRPTLTLAETDGITYSVDPSAPYVAGQSVTVTATLDPAGVGWPGQLPDGWQRVTATRATFEVTFADVSCAPVVPMNPGVTQATCLNGEVTTPRISAVDTAGIVYVLDPPGPYDGTRDATVMVTATVINGFGWMQMPPGWTQIDPATATFTVQLTGTTCEQVSPVEPATTQAVCVDGVVSEPTLTLAETDGITYSADPAAPYVAGQSVTVKATLAPAGVGWPRQLPPGWTKDSATVATLTVVFDAVACTPVAPVDPGVSVATCADGSVSAPSVALPVTPGVTYSLRPFDLGDGMADSEVVVTATVDPGFGWGTISAPWVRVDDATAQLTVTLPGTSCDEVTPVAPALTQAVCANGVLSTPTLELGTTDGIIYTVAHEGPYAAGDTVTVIATLAPAAVGWPDQLPDGWTRKTATRATYTVLFDDVSCTPVAPVGPTVAQATCANGAVTAPEITVPETLGVAYVLDPAGPYVGTRDTTVTVTATLADGFEWDQLPPGWTRVDATTATVSVQLVGASCDEVTPAAPALIQAVCVAGVVWPPSLTLPSTDGISYTVDPPAPYSSGQTVAVTATLAPAGVGWPATLPAGWTATSDTTATNVVTFDAVACKPGTPATPTVLQATCVNGGVSEPAISLPPTAGITYVADPAGPYDGTKDTVVTVTASAQPGYGWGSMAPGWAQQDTYRASFSVQLSGTSCAQRFPVAPAVTQAVCANGVVSPPTLRLPTTDGITYSVDPGGPYSAGQTVTVTATLAPAGLGLPPQAQLAPGWTTTSATTATYPVTFDQAACAPVAPVAPSVTQATCVNGEVIAPTISLPATAGVVYTVDPQGPYGLRRPTDAVVTASLLDGFAWGELPAGWTLTSPTAASYTVSLPGSPECATPTTPTTPTTTLTTPTTGPTTTPSGGPLPTTLPGELARTGAKAERIQLEVILALLALVAGSVFWVIGGRRRKVRRQW